MDGMNRRRYGSLALLSLAVALWVQIGREGAALVLTQQAADEITFSNGGLQSAQRHLERAHEFAPRSGWTREKLGEVRLLLLGSTTPSDALEAARQAASDFRGALQARPTSPYLWADLALAKLYAGEEDREMFDALRNAEELGPWDPEVLQSVVYVGLAVWDEIEPAYRSVVMRALAHGAQVSGAETLATAKQFHRLDLVCQIKELAVIDPNECGTGSKM